MSQSPHRGIVHSDIMAELARTGGTAVSQSPHRGIVHSDGTPPVVDPGRRRRLNPLIEESSIRTQWIMSELARTGSQSPHRGIVHSDVNITETLIRVAWQSQSPHRGIVHSDSRPLAPPRLSGPRLNPLIEESSIRTRPGPLERGPEPGRSQSPHRGIVHSDQNGPRSAACNR